jgi:hypothetical protein
MRLLLPHLKNGHEIAKGVGSNCNSGAGDISLFMQFTFEHPNGVPGRIAVSSPGWIPVDGLYNPPFR